MHITATEQPPERSETDLRVVLAGPGATLLNPGTLDAAEREALERVLGEDRFDAQPGQTLTVRLPQGRFTVAGAGAGPVTPADARRIGHAAAREAARHRAHRVILDAPPAPHAAYHAAVAASVTAYRDDRYRSASEPRVEHLELLGADPRDAERAQVVADAVDLARDLVNAPANELTPEALAAVAARAAAEHDLEIDVWDRAACERAGMNLFLAVAAGSSNEPRFIRLRHRPKGASADAPRVAIVGKGVTFDTGGYSLKTRDGMTTMKADMAGAAAVIAAMTALRALNASVDVTAYVAATDNVVAANAAKPGDIHRGVTGTTVEITNTDAEGRLTLADAIAIAERDGAAEIIDLATLTGAVTVALGESIAGLFTNDAGLERRVRDAAARAHEKIWPLPLEASYLESYRGGPADLKNSNLKPAGAAITAALFLNAFVTVPWAHLDIAGPAFAKTATADAAAGGTGFGVQTLLEYLAPLEP